MIHRRPQFSNPSIRPVLLTSLILVAIVSISSNSLIIHVIRTSPDMRSTTNYLILNMTVGDMFGLVAIVGCARYLFVGNEWNGDNLFYKVLCKAYMYLINISILCSVFSLVATSYDRFIAVRHPLKHKHRRPQWIKVVILFVWIMSLLLPSYFSTIQVTVFKNNNISYCGMSSYFTDEAYYLSFFFFGGYIIPHVVIVTFYVIIGYSLWTRRLPGNQSNDAHFRSVHQTAKRVTAMIACILLIFEICVSPIFISYCLPYSFQFLRRQIWRPITLPIVTILANLNGFFNALVYCVFASSFRKAFARYLPNKCIGCRWKRKRSVHQQVIVPVLACAPSVMLTGYNVKSKKCNRNVQRTPT